MLSTTPGWHLGPEFPCRVLGLMLRDTDFLPHHHGDLRQEYFENLYMQTLAHLALTHFHQQERTPSRDDMVALVLGWVHAYDTDGTQKLNQNLMSWLDYVWQYDIGDSDFVKGQVAKYGSRQRMKGAMGEVFSIMENEKPDDADGSSDTVHEKMVRLLDDAARRNITEDPGVDLGNAAVDLPQLLLDDMTYGASHKVPTGIADLDKALKGGLGSPEVGCLMGLPGAGKTTVLSIFGANAAQHFYEMHAIGRHPVLRTVVHVTCEMVELDILTKYMAKLTNMEIDDITINPDLYRQRHGQVAGSFSPIRIKYFDPGSTTVEELKWYISNLVLGEGIVPGLIIVDYADLLKGGEDDRFQGMGRIYDQLIQIARKFSAPVWTGSQVRKAEARNDIITQTGVAESWKKVEKASVIVTLNQKQEERDRNRIRLYTAKVRRGKAWQILHCNYHPGCCQLWSMTGDDVNRLGLDDTGGSAEDAGELAAARTQSMAPKEEGPPPETPPAPQVIPEGVVETPVSA